MKALVLNRYGGPLEITDMPVPVPSAGQVLVRIAASGLNPLDIKIRAGNAAHARHPVPLVLGIDLAGTVEAVGPGVSTSDGKLAPRIDPRRFDLLAAERAYDAMTNGTASGKLVVDVG
jgi:NADPH:quinone reductase-like Zn-dependent oxidoreductase